MLEIFVLVTLLALAVYAQADGVPAQIDWMQLLREAGPAAVVLAYFLWRIERALLNLATELRLAVAHRVAPPDD